MIRIITSLFHNDMVRMERFTDSTLICLVFGSGFPKRSPFAKKMCGWFDAKIRSFSLSEKICLIFEKLAEYLLHGEEKLSCAVL